MAFISARRRCRRWRPAARTRRSSALSPTTTCRDRRMPTTSIKTCTRKAGPDHRRRRGVLGGPGHADDPDLQEGRDHGRPSELQRHRHGADARRAMSSLVTSHLTPQTAWRSAVADRHERPAVRLRRQAGGQEAILFGTDGTNSPSQFNIPGTYVSSFGPDIAAARARSTRRSSRASPSTVPTGRSASRHTRPPTS